MRSFAACVAALATVSLSGCTSQKWAQPTATAPLTLTVVPYEKAEKLSDNYTPMADYLARRTGRPNGVFRYVPDYTGVVAALQSGQVDVAYLSPLPYAIATQHTKLQPLAMPHVKGSLMYRGIIFVRADSPIKTIQDLAGRTFAFGDQSSTSGYLLPRAMLEKAGVFPKLKKYFNAGSAPVVVKAVETGAQDAGAAFENVLDLVYKDEPAKAKQMRVIAQTEAIPNGIYVARGDLPAAEVEKLRKAFMDMNTDPDGRAAMLKAPNDKEVPPDDAAFNGVREVAKILGLNLQALSDKKK